MLLDKVNLLSRIFASTISASAKWLMPQDTFRMTIDNKMQKRSGGCALGYAAGIAAGVSYGLNPLFAKPLMDSGVPVLVMLFFRYFFSVLMLGGWMLLRRESFRVNGGELRILAMLGLLFSCSSLFLFCSYRYIPSGLATTIVYLYPVFVAMIMVVLKVLPDWRTWLSIVATFVGILLLSKPSGGTVIHIGGLALAVVSALSYAFYLVVVNRSRRIRHISEHTLTFYALLAGSLLFAVIRTVQGGSLVEGVDTLLDWGLLAGLAIFQTVVSMLTLAVSTRVIGPTKTSVLGVFEPLTAMFVGVAVFGELLTAQMAVGVGICIAAVVFMIRKP